MGNSIQKDFAISENPIGSTPIFQIFSAINKKTKDQVSIFRCKIKSLEDKYGVHQAKQIVNRIKKTANYQFKVRQPTILQILQPPIDSKSDIYIITEPVKGTFSNLFLNDWNDLMNVTKKPIQKISDIEIQYGLAQILEALIFLKKESCICHLNLSPSSIFISRSGDWKLGGFEFAVYCGSNSVNSPISTGSGGGTGINPPGVNIETLEPEEYLRDPFFFSKNVKGSSLPNNLFSPNLDFCAPEYVTLSNYSFASDIFSFAALYYFLRNFSYNKDNMSNIDDVDVCKLFSFGRNLTTYQTIITNFSKNPNNFSKPFLLAQQFQTLIKCLSSEPATRLDPQYLLKESQMFGDDVNALRCLARIQNMDLETKTLVLKELPSVLHSFPNHVLMDRVLPVLIRESRKNIELAVASLPNILLLGEKVSAKKFTSKILPTLGRLFTVTTPADIPIHCLRNLHTIIQKTDEIGRKDHVTPFLVRCLQNDIPTVRIEALRSIESCIVGRNQLLPEELFRVDLLPRIIAIIKETSNAIVRHSALETIKNCIHILERNAISEVIPALEYCLSIDKSRETCNTIISIYSLYSKKAHPKEIAIRILPILITLSVETSLEFEDFTIYMSIVKGMIQTIENYRIMELEKLEARRKQAQQQQIQDDLSKLSNASPLPEDDFVLVGDIAQDKYQETNSEVEYNSNLYAEDANIQHSQPSQISTRDNASNDYYQYNQQSSIKKPELELNQTSKRDENFDNLLNKILSEPVNVNNDDIEIGDSSLPIPQSLMDEDSNHSQSLGSEYVDPGKSWFDNMESRMEQVINSRIEDDNYSPTKSLSQSISISQSNSQSNTQSHSNSQSYNQSIGSTEKLFENIENVNPSQWLEDDTNPMKFFDMDSNELENEGTTQTEQKRISQAFLDGDDDMFESLLAKHTS